MEYLMKFGKSAARPGAVKLQLRDYLPASLPAAPLTFGHQALIEAWGMLGNDEVGCCAWAGAAHETMLWCAEGGHPVEIDTANVLDDYSAVTGYNAADPSTDQGTDIQQAAEYRRTTGIRDAAGTRHMIGAYAAITTGDPDELGVAAYLFGAVGIGIQVPAYAMDQFQRGAAWDLSNGPAEIQGGHYIPVVGRDSDGNFLVVTWGQLQRMTPAFYKQWNDESIAYLSEEMLTGGKSPEGFDLDQLHTDLAEVTGAS